MHVKNFLKTNYITLVTIKHYKNYKMFLSINNAVKLDNGCLNYSIVVCLLSLLF